MKDLNGASVAMNLIAIPVITKLNFIAGLVFAITLVITLSWERRKKYEQT